jgi:hypothetical protein
MCQSFLVLFFKKEPLALPLACRGGDLHTWAVTFFEKKKQTPFGCFGSGLFLPFGAALRHYAGTMRF